MPGFLEQGGEMEHDVDAANVRIEGRVRGQVENQSLAALIPDGFGLVGMERRAGHVTAVFAKAAEQRAADEPGRTGDQQPFAGEGPCPALRHGEGGGGGRDG